MRKTTGGCLCGAVRFEADGDSLFSSNCHCRDCQKVSGGAYLPVTAFPEGAVHVSGAVKSYRRPGDSGGTVSESFCPECGAHLFAQADALPGLLLLHAGNLDDPSAYEPQLDIFTASAQRWDHMDPNLPKYPGMPPLGG